MNMQEFLKILMLRRLLRSAGELTDELGNHSAIPDLVRNRTAALYTAIHSEILNAEPPRPTKPEGQFQWRIPRMGDECMAVTGHVTRVVSNAEYPELSLWGGLRWVKVTGRNTL